jgi:hypothetical protein
MSSFRVRAAIPRAISWGLVALTFLAGLGPIRPLQR